MEIIKLKTFIKIYRFFGGKRPICPECGWTEGDMFHCGFCEGNKSNLDDKCGKRFEPIEEKIDDIKSDMNYELIEEKFFD